MLQITVKAATRTDQIDSRGIIVRGADLPDPLADKMKIGSAPDDKDASQDRHGPAENSEDNDQGIHHNKVVKILETQFFYCV